MLVKDAKQALLYKAGADTRGNPSDALLSELFMEAMLYVCNKCVPNELLAQQGSHKVYRYLQNGYFLFYPDKPIFDENDPLYDDKEHLMIDETLTYAVINYVAFLLTNDAKFHQLANELIGEFIATDSKGL